MESQPLISKLDPENSWFPKLSSAEVEELLENKQLINLPWWSRLIAWESKVFWSLSWASSTSTLFCYLISFVTLAFVGHLGDVAFAGASVTCIAFQGLANGLMVGMASAVVTLCGQAYGAKRFKGMGIACQRSIVLLLVVAVLLSFLYWYSGPVLELFGRSESAGIVEQGQIFARGMIPQLFAYAFSYPMLRYLQAQGIVKPLAYMSVAVFLVHVLLSWVAVDVLGYGVLGAALTLSLSWWILVFCIAFYIVLSPRCKETRSLDWSFIKSMDGLWPFFKLSVASAVMFCMDMWYWQLPVLIAELLPNATIAIDSFSICIDYFNWDLNFMLGMSYATSVLVGNELGAAHPRLAKFSVLVMSVISTVITIILCAIVAIFRVPLINLYSSNSEVLEVTTTLLPFLIASIFINGIHLACLGVIIGSGRQPLLVIWNLVTFYVIGLPLGCVLGFKTSLEIVGLYLGLLIGFILETAVLVVIVIRTNWSGEVDKAIARLKIPANEETVET